MCSTATVTQQIWSIINYFIGSAFLCLSPLLLCYKTPHFNSHPSVLTEGRRLKGLLLIYSVKLLSENTNTGAKIGR